jgi:hypothetical protein
MPARLLLTEVEKTSRSLEALTNRTVFWDLKPYNPLRVNRRFGGTYHLHFQGPIIFIARNRAGSTCHLLQRYFDPEDGGEMILRNGLIFNGLQGVISRKTEPFITTAVGTSDLSEYSLS